MLYLSTRSTADCYTAYRALNEPKAPDGGLYVPFHLQRFTAEELLEIKSQSSCAAIAKVLNLFFGTQLTGWDVECVVGKNPVRMESMNQRLLIAEFWHNTEGSVQYYINNLYRKIADKENAATKPAGWAYLSIQIALLFGAYAAMERGPEQGIDVAVATGDFADISAVLYAKEMGLPVNMILCATNENSTPWELFTKGDFHTGISPVQTTLQKLDVTQPEYMEALLSIKFGETEVQRYLEACSQKQVYRIGAEQLNRLSENLFCAVISTSRVDSLVSGMQSSNGYVIDPYTAVAYGGLQTYRANTGANRDTLILAKDRPAPAKE